MFASRRNEGEAGLGGTGAYFAPGGKPSAWHRSSWCSRVMVSGDPEESKISTSYVERANLTMRMGMRRFTRLTNGFSKKVENHFAAIALHFFFYNFGRAHKSLANPYPRTPAMAAGIADHIWTCEEIAALLH